MHFLLVSLIFARIAQRLLTAVSAVHGDDATEAVSRALFRRVWCTDDDVTTPASLAAACEGAGLDEGAIQALVNSVSDPKIKQALLETTNSAVMRGAFGAPTIFATNALGEERMFFGADRFPLLARFLHLPWYGPFPHKDMQDIQHVMDGHAKL